jgi:hypothetical protein
LLQQRRFSFFSALFEMDDHSANTYLASVLYFTFKYKIDTAKINVTIFATIIGKSFINKPYISQKSTPAVNMLYIINEIPSVFFSLMVLIACGRKESVVRMAAKYPK